MAVAYQPLNKEFVMKKVFLVFLATALGVGCNGDANNNRGTTNPSNRGTENSTNRGTDTNTNRNTPTNTGTTGTGNTGTGNTGNGGGNGGQTPTQSQPPR